MAVGLGAHSSAITAAPHPKKTSVVNVPINSAVAFFMKVFPCFGYFDHALLVRRIQRKISCRASNNKHRVFGRVSSLAKVWWNEFIPSTKR